MKRPKSILVLGRGIIGLTCALRLAEAGFDVCLAGPKNLFGTASYAALGVTSLKGLLWPRNPFFAAKWRGQQDLWSFLREIEEKSGKAIPKNRPGVVEPCVTPQSYYDVKKRIYNRMFTGAFRIRPPDGVSRGYHSDHGPGRPPLVRNAFYYPQDFWFDPKGLLAALEIRLDQLGVSKLSSEAKQVTVGSEGRLTVEGSDWTYQPSTLILATGANLTAHTNSFFGWQAPVTRLSGGHWECPFEGPASDFEATVIAGKSRAAIHKGRILLGSTQTRLPPTSETGVWHEIMESESTLYPQFIDRLSTVFPQSLLKAQEPKFLWGVRLQGRDKKPIFGDLLSKADGRVILAGGFGKTGFLLAPAAGRNMIRLLKNEALSSEFASFSPTRFES